MIYKLYDVIISIKFNLNKVHTLVIDFRPRAVTTAPVVALT